MAEDPVNPCANGLTPECFAKQPSFARQAFSFRLLSAFVPPALSKGLLTFLGLIRFDPSGQIPAWLNLPPWWIITPDAIIPPDWQVGDPPFAGLLIPPIFSPAFVAGKKGEAFSSDQLAALIDAGGLAATLSGPTNIIAGGSGPPRPPNYSSPVIDPWLYDGFSSLDLLVWEKWLDGAATIELLGGGNIDFVSQGSDYCILRTAADGTIPDKWVLTFRVYIDNYTGGDPNFVVTLYTGDHAVKFRLNPPTTVWHATGAGADEITVPNYLDVYRVFSLRYDDGYTDLFMDGVLISSNQHHQHSGSSKGRISFDNNNDINTRLDYVSIDPN